MAVTPIVFVHGIQGSWLKDEYPVDYDDRILWTGILHRNFDRLHLHAADASVDRDVRRVVQPHQAVPLIYEGIVNEIREEMEPQPYVYVFTYDWRKDNRSAAQALAAFVERILHVVGVHERAARRRKPTRVTLIGHSMGGLVIKWCATEILDARTVARIITIATPYRGSLKAIEALVPGARNLFGMEHQKSMRHGARTLPGIFQLLPSWKEAVVDTRGKPLDIFDPDDWQRNVVAALKKAHGPEYLPRKLRDAQSFSRAMRAAWPDKLQRKLFYAHGLGSSTWRQVRVHRSDGNFYDFAGALEDNDGDGSVHRESGVRPEIPDSRTYEDTPELLGDLITGQHANMPNHGALQDWILGVIGMNQHADATFASPR